MNGNWGDVTQIDNILSDIWKQVVKAKDFRKVAHLKKLLASYSSYITKYHPDAISGHRKRTVSYLQGKSDQIYEKLIKKATFLDYYGPTMAGIAILGTLIYAAYKYFPSGSKLQQEFLGKVKGATGIPVDKLTETEVNQIIHDFEALPKYSRKTKNKIKSRLKTKSKSGRTRGGLKKKRK